MTETLMPTIDQLRNGDTRANDWDGYGADGTTDAALDAAERFSKWLTPRLPEWCQSFSASTDGGVVLELDHVDGGGGILIEWEPDGRSVADVMMTRLSAHYDGVEHVEP